ncbi:uncharacterized protein LOC130654149 [Hydractinia symbiolongicarpus]|uniref:uncharacterized protein LOC130654149 n=1 Tax=Hydractinia symbiolongicarpus TaxID=13093 RepID=UPI00254CFF10|nr:uncharacterized protein LOC130654149 [Hydractinia symbiolongicarpus]
MDKWLIVVTYICTCGAMTSLTDNEIPSTRQDKSIKNAVESWKEKEFKVFEPVPCQIIKSPFGCCWDKKSIPTGSNGEGCPACKDHKHMKCRKWKPFCGDKRVRSNCPKTCGQCSSESTERPCSDDPDWKPHCPAYKRIGLCRLSDIASQCEKTCNKC